MLCARRPSHLHFSETKADRALEKTLPKDKKTLPYKNKKSKLFYKGFSRQAPKYTKYSLISLALYVTYKSRTVELLVYFFKYIIKRPISLEKIIIPASLNRLCNNTII